MDGANFVLSIYGFEGHKEIILCYSGQNDFVTPYIVREVKTKVDCHGILRSRLGEEWDIFCKMNNFNVGEHTF